MENIQRLTYHQIKDGHVPDDECRILQDHAAGKVCLEVGSWFGRSTVAIAETASLVHAVDTFKGIPPEMEQSDGFTSLDGFMKNTAGYKNIEVHIGRSSEILPSLPMVDFVFIDGSHDYEDVKDDAIKSLELLKPGGRIFFHDYYPAQAYPGVKQTVDELFTGIEGEFGMMVWVSKEMAR